jgi:L-gulono-1,4-lactone dehydrogenase
VTWQNWSGTERCAPTRVLDPRTSGELAEELRRITERGGRAKAVGAGHSFTSIAATDDVQVRLDHLASVGQVDGRRVTVGAGITIAALNRELAARGLALPNLGDIAYQTVAGATSTATHGTGITKQGIASQIVAFELATASGEVLVCAPDEEPELFHCGRVGLGALGIVTRVTLECVDAFRLHAVEEPMAVEEIDARLDELIADNDHFEFFYVPHTSSALTKRNNVTDEPVGGRGRVRELATAYLLENLAFGAVCRAGRRWPEAVPRLAKVVAGGSRSSYVRDSGDVFASPRLVRFVEMEYSLPVEAAMPALADIRAAIDRSGLRISFPIEVRFLGGDDIPLSTATGAGARAYLAVHVYRGVPYEQYFGICERIFRSYGGRPHWGKRHTQTAETLAPLYPEWERFAAVRERLDPAGTFRNEYLDRVLGWPA